MNKFSEILWFLALCLYCCLISWCLGRGLLGSNPTLPPPKEKLETRIKELEEALRFYANEDNWSEPKGGGARNIFRESETPSYKVEGGAAFCQLCPTL